MKQYNYMQKFISILFIICSILSISFLYPMVVYAASGQCGPAANQHYISDPYGRLNPSLLCSAGTLADSNDDTTYWKWKCNRTLNSGTSPTCSAYKVYCGSNQGKALTVQPTTDLCEDNDFLAQNMQLNGDRWQWNCVDSENASVACWAWLKVDGACGDAQNHDYVNAPISDLCAAGTLRSGYPINTGNDTWKWYCDGSNGGSNKTCYADIVNCGYAQGRTYTTQPPSADLCSEGTPSTPLDNGSTWTWTCTDFIGQSVSCWAYDKDNGVCGSAQGQYYVDPPTSGLCNEGNPSAVTTSGNQWRWQCLGVNGGTTTNCWAYQVINGACGLANGGSYENAPTTGLCSIGTASAVTDSGPNWTWTCAGINGGSTATCSASHIADGACGYANGGSYETAPTTGLCTVGTPSSVTDNGATWIWTCAGYGAGATASCSAIHLTAADTSINQYCAAPPFIISPVEPNVLSVVDVSGSMDWCAYNPTSNKENCCDSSSGCGWTYTGDEEGYFRPDKNYRYNSTEGYWEETVTSAVSCPKRKGDIDTAKVYKGSCLNFLYMRRIDLVRWAMTGGRPASCTGSHTFNAPYCDPELWAEPGNAGKVGEVCNDTIGGCILLASDGLRKIKVPWSRVYDGLAFQFKQMSLKPRMGVMFYSSSGVRSAGQVYMGDFTAPNSTDNRFPYMNLITAFNSSTPSGGTPTGPAMWDAFNYFKQVDPQYGGIPVQQGSGDRWKNPLYVCDGGGSNCTLVQCAKNFVMLMSDGQWNQPSCSIDNNAADPVKPAYQMHQTFINAPANVTTDINAVHTIGLFLGGTGEQSLKNVAMYGSFNKMNAWPDSLTGYPSDVCDMDDCSSEGKGSGCTPLPASTSDWDSNNDGRPDTFHAATNATEIKDAIKNAILDMLRRASSGTAVSVLSSSEGSGANLIQALFYPRRTFGGTEISWVSDVMNYWYYMDPFFTYSQIREDTVRDNSAYTLLNLTNDYIVSFAFDGTQNKTIAHRWQDTDGNGSPDVDRGSVPIEEAAAIWRAGIQLWKTSPVAGYRPTPKTTIDGLNLLEGGFSVANVDTLKPYLGITDTAMAKKIINYVKGYDCADTAGNPSEPAASCSNPSNSCCPTGYSPIGRNRTVTINGETHVWKLGDVINSTPRIMGPSPLNNYNIPAPIGYNDQTYYDFISSAAYKNRERVFVGANDGMFHAFRLGKLTQGGDQIAKLEGSVSEIGAEKWSYIPKHVLPYLKYLAVQDYCHVYMVDGPITLVDASINGAADASRTVNSWRTVVIGSMGIGGATIKKTCNGTSGGQSCDEDSDCPGGQQCKNPDINNRVGVPVLDGSNNPVGLSSYFAFDVTNQDEPQLLWEFTHPDLGVANVGPAIVKVGGKDKKCSVSNTSCTTDADCSGSDNKCVMTKTNGNWYAVLASGPTGPITSQEFYGKSNQNLKLFILDLKTGTLVRTIDTEIRNAFAGSINFSTLDLEKNDTGATGNYQDDALYIGYVKDNTSGGVLRLVMGDNSNPSSWTVSRVIDDIGPVTTSVVNLLDRKNGKLWLYFGEGRYYHKTDDLSNQRRLYGIIEPCVTGSSLNIETTCSTSISANDLQNQTTPAASLAPGKKGWYINLDNETSASGAERVISNPVASTSGAVFFLSFAPTSDICSFGGNTYLWAVDYKSGGQVSYAMKGKALIQVSTGEIKELDLSSPSTFPDKNNRRSGGIQGIPPTGQGLMVMDSPPPIRKFMHVQER